MLLLALSTSAWAGPRSLVGFGFPTTETPGLELISGTIDWGTPEILPSATYDIDFGATTYTGTFSLVSTVIAGPAAQLIYSDASNGLTMTAISADGPFSLTAADFVDTAGYGGFEAWTLTDTAAALNRYGTITKIVDVPNPSTFVLGLMALCGFVGYGAFVSINPK